MLDRPRERSARQRLRVHTQRTGALVDAVEREYRRGTQVRHWGHGILAITHGADGPMATDALATLEAGRLLLAADGEMLVSVASVAASRAVADDVFLSPGTRILSALSRKRLPFVADDVRLLLSLAASARSRWFPPQIAPTVTIAEAWCGQHGPAEVERELRELMQAVLGHRKPGSDRERTGLAGRLRSLIADDRLDLSAIDEKEDFGKRARQSVSALRPEGLAPLLVHLASAGSSRPSGVWQRRAIELAEAAPDGDRLVRGLLESAVEAVPRTDSFAGVQFSLLYAEDVNATLLRGALWAAAALRRPWAAPLATSILRRVVDAPSKVTTACVYGLGELGTPDALTALSQARARVTDRGLLKLIDRALEGAAERAGMSRSELRETLVQTLGLDDRSSRTTTIGDATVRVEVLAPGRVVATWSKDGRTLRGVPASVKTSCAGDLRAVQLETGKLRAAVAAERRRAEDLFGEDRSWRLPHWRGRYLRHPLQRPVSAGLIWTFDGRAALVRDGGFVALDGPAWRPADDALVRLWHPLSASADEVARSRRWLMEHQVVQPFKQAHREVYLLAPAEEQTRTYSNRFAAHVLNYPQMYALLKERGWGGNALGPWDGGNLSTVFRDFDAHGIRAELSLERIETERWGTVAELASTDQVRFRPIGGREHLPLSDVPPIVFSEAMRDVDLLVGVSSIAADPEWIDRGPDRFRDYWRDTAYGKLTESAASRRELLVELLPSLRIADRCHVDDRFLVVRGRRRMYRIHLGSGNILMEPNGQYLCIVPVRREHSQPRLPFEGDERLSVILSKAFMLADDHRIRDQTIIRQIGR
jgi:uncharacterized protein DUF4132